MSKLFSMDSKFMRVMGRIGDLILLNLLFLVTSLPIFTIGAATTAMYTVCFRFGSDRESGTTRSFFEAFRVNFKQATILWLIMLLILATAFFNAIFFWLLPSAIRYGALIFVFIFLLAFFMLSYAFPLLSQFDNKNMGILKNSLIMSMGYLPRTLVIAAINILPWVLLLTNIILFLQGSFLWVMIYFAGAAFINTKLLHKVFAPYMTELDD